jgi:hypothetical protein
MEVATIVPVPYLNLVENYTYHLALTHILKQSKKYSDFYKKQSEKGAYVIVDNGAAEGACEPIETILEYAENIDANEIVLPDHIYDQQSTLHASHEALNYVLKHIPSSGCKKIMVVPQGKNFKEWCDCASIMASWGVDVIGISKFCTPKYGKKSRLKLTEFLHNQVIPEYPHIKIHLLGCWDFPLEITEIVQTYKVRGTDSAIAYVYASNGKALLPAFERPKLEVDFLNGRVPNDAILKNNILLWRGYSNGAV